MFLFNRNQATKSINIIPEPETEEWVQKFSSKYYEIKDHYYNLSFGDDLTLYALIYCYFDCEFENSRVEDIMKPVKEFTNSPHFKRTKPETIFRTVEEALKQINDELKECAG